MSFERLILASQSPRRIALLRQLGIAFEVYPSQGEEPLPEAGEDPLAYTLRAALHKAHQVQRSLELRDAWILAADTVVLLDQEILGKPSNEAEARGMLTRLAGQQHQVMTSFVLLHQSKGIEYEETVETQVWFRKVTPLQIQRYVKSHEPMDKAGAYAIQEKGAFLVERIEGCYFNIVGLPIGHLVVALEKHGAGTLL